LGESRRHPARFRNATFINLQDSNVAFLNLRRLVHGQVFLALVVIAALLTAVAGSSSGARRPGVHAGSA
jgi:hypothetical protein